MAELESMQPRLSQWLPGQEIPEKHWMYKIAKQFWFNDFNAYRQLPANSRPKASGSLPATSSPKAAA
jgi:hypothetical protein